MYFLVALLMTVIALGLLLFVKTKKNVHVGILAIIFGAATLMWLIDCIASAIEGEGFISFELPLDIWISIWTVVGGIFFYFIILLIFYIQEKRSAKANKQVESK